LDDIKPCFLAEMKVRFIAGVPHLIIVFEHPNLEAKPACAVRLVTISRSNPLAPGNPLEGDRLKRVVRTAVETYLHKHGIRIPTPQFELRSQ
jgi:hypothetical protein